MSEMWEFLPVAVADSERHGMAAFLCPVSASGAPGEARGGVAIGMERFAGVGLWLQGRAGGAVSGCGGEGHLSRPQGVPMEPGGHRWWDL